MAFLYDNDISTMSWQQNLFFFNGVIKSVGIFQKNIRQKEKKQRIFSNPLFNP